MTIKLEKQVFEMFRSFKLKGYNFCSFEDNSWKNGTSPKLILRHDVDFDCEIAYQFAQKQAQHDVFATYYFLMKSDAYNLISQKNIALVNKIRELGHSISLHFDPVGFDDTEVAVNQELDCFEAHFNYRPKVISIHRPMKQFIGEDFSTIGAEHTYMSKYTKNLKYFSDSGGQFKYGHPMDSSEFWGGKDIHLLIHPIWWVDINCERIEKLDWLLEKKRIDMEILMSQNCIPYDAHLNSKNKKTALKQ